MEIVVSERFQQPPWLTAEDEFAVEEIELAMPKIAHILKSGSSNLLFFFFFKVILHSRSNRHLLSNFV